MTQELLQRLRAGKEAMAKRCREAATKIAEEAGVKTIHEDRKTLSGWAWPASKTISVPPPTTRRRLFIYAHECAHVALDHIGKTPRHREEYEAQRWAIEAMRRYGVPVPKRSLQRAKSHVGWKIIQAVRRGAKKVNRTALNWSLAGMSWRSRQELYEAGFLSEQQLSA